MKKILLAGAFATAALLTNAQGKVGVNTTTPQATLDVKGDATNTKTMRITKPDATESITILNNGNVGINNNNPQATLHVNGNQILINTPIASPTDNVSTLAKDNSTGEIKVIQTGTNTKLISYIKYNFTNTALDYIRDYDTKIDASKYFVSLAGFNFNSTDGTNPLLTNDPNVSTAGYNPLNIYVFIKNGTWHVSADYFGGLPMYTTGKFKWDIDLLVLHSSLVNNLGSIPVNMNSSPDGSATTSPSGL